MVTFSQILCGCWATHHNNPPTISLIDKSLKYDLRYVKFGCSVPDCVGGHAQHNKQIQRQTVRQRFQDNLDKKYIYIYTLNLISPEDWKVFA